RVRRGGRDTHGGGTRVVGRPSRPRGRPLPQARRRRAREPDHARRRDRRRGADGCAGRRAGGPPVSAPNVLLVAATKAEAAHLPADLPLVLTGIGKTEAAVATTEAIAALRPDLVINV